MTVQRKDLRQNGTLFPTKKIRLYKSEVFSHLSLIRTRIATEDKMMPDKTRMPEPCMAEILRQALAGLAPTAGFTALIDRMERAA